MATEDNARELAQEAGRYFAKQRKKYRKKCVICGVEFEGIATALYDKSACRKLAYYRRQHQRPTGPAD